ncbi:hypothetical protein MPL3365_130466 [Mesorhizobium plurifarium]|uniref:Uncharacterized protein n=1 Tax=Mesorhizobium plurifarium TaxID=69974 RepID=A0A090G3L0_MESPL|nr:hypothetical protein MPL3365_130466 [Mesorhizobium plurifarium]
MACGRSTVQFAGLIQGLTPLGRIPHIGSWFDLLICESAKLDSIDATPSRRVNFSFRKRS